MQDPASELLVAWVAAIAFAAVRIPVALVSGAGEPSWLLISGVVLWVGLPVAVITLSLAAGSLRRRPEKPPETTECGPIVFGLGMGLYTVPYVIGLAAPWLGVPAALRLALATCAVVTLLGVGLAFASSRPPGSPKPPCPRPGTAPGARGAVQGRQ